MNGQSTNALVGPLDSDVAIKSRIFTIRGVQVMLDHDLAELYGVSTKALNQAVKRNIRRFPDDFMLQLRKEDVENLRSQFVTSSWGGLRYMPYAFTEHGVIMLASVLKSETAIVESVRITKVFVAMRKAIASIAPVMARIAETERLELEERAARLADQQRNEERFDTIFKAMDGGEFPPRM